MKPFFRVRVFKRYVITRLETLICALLFIRVILIPFLLLFVYICRTFKFLMHVLVLIFIFLYILLPLVFRFWPAFQRHMVFLPFSKLLCNHHCLNKVTTS